MSDRSKKLEQEEEPSMPEFTLQRKYIELIRSGRKTVEGRINSGGFRKFKPGDRVKFFDGKDPQCNVVCRIVGIGRYKGFREMLEGEGVDKMLPDAESLNDAVDTYNRIPSYPERARKNGVIALRLEVIDPISGQEPEVEASKDEEDFRQKES